MPLDFQTFSSATILGGLIITAAFIVLIPDWRLALFALIVQYLVAATLLVELVPFQIALVRLLSGMLALLILYFTLRQKSERLRHALTASDDATIRPEHYTVFVVGLPFRFFALALVAIGILGITTSLSFLGVSGNVLFSGMWLITAGILVAILSRDVLRLGMGILMLTCGFSILETATESSLLLFGLLNISDLLIALVIAHLGVLPVRASPQRRHGESQ